MSNDEDEARCVKDGVVQDTHELAAELLELDDWQADSLFFASELDSSKAVTHLDRIIKAGNYQEVGPPICPDCGEPYRQDRKRVWFHRCPVLREREEKRKRRRRKGRNPGARTKRHSD